MPHIDIHTKKFSSLTALKANHYHSPLTDSGPSLTSYLVVAATLTIPGMMLTEATLSFLGFGIHEPMTSWGQLLNAANNVVVIQLHPWLLIPGIFIVVGVLSFNFMGDALRDAFDPFTIV